MTFDFGALFSNAWTYVGIVVLLALIAIFKMSEKKVFGVNKIVVGIIASALLLTSVYQTGLLSGFGYAPKTFAVGDEFGTETETEIQTETPTPSLSEPAPKDQPSTGGKICRIQSDGSNSLDSAIINKQNSTLAYLGASATAIANDDTTLDTATTTGGASLTYVTLSVPGCQEGNIYVLGTAGVGVASAKAAFSSYEEVTKYEIPSANSNVIAVQGRSSALATASGGLTNGSDSSLFGDQAISGVGATDGTAYFRNTSLSAGGSLNGYLDWTVNGTAGVYGAYAQEDGALFSYNSGTASVYSKDSFSFSDLTGINLKELSSCPSTITANRNAEKCWSARTLKGTDGEIRTKFQLKADLADPGVGTTQPTLCVDDKVYFRDTNGKIAYDFFSSSGTNQGVGGTCIQFPAS